MLFEELLLGLQVISPQGDIFEVCAISNGDKTVLVKVNEFAAKNHGDEDPMDKSGRAFTRGNSGWITEHGKNAMRQGFYEVGYRDLSLWRDDIPEFKTGDFVKDLDGNKYEIVDTKYSYTARYQLALREFSSDFIERNADKCRSFEEPGSIRWIYNTQNDAVLADDYTGIYQLFATELKLTEFTPRPDEIPVAPKEAKPVAPVNAKRPSIEEIREITAQAENADLDKALDEIYPKILEAAERGEHTVVLENDMVDSLKLQVYGYLSDAGFMVRELFMGDSFEIKW
nr:MAG TPA: hypothetical protein [Bacteriophage sp.]